MSQNGSSPRERVLNVLEADPPIDPVTISRTHHGWVVGVHTLGQSRIVAHCPYLHYARAVGIALAEVLDVDLDDRG